MGINWKLMVLVTLAIGLYSCDKENSRKKDLSGGCEAVDLGLSVKWASWNVGAKSETDCGFYFAWGETVEKQKYDWSGYKWGSYVNDKSLMYGMTKYTGNMEGGDGLVTLESGDDAATRNWGGKWRTPTVEEIEELLDTKKCEWSWDEERSGYSIKGIATGETIFLPAAGTRGENMTTDLGLAGCYWSSSVYTDPYFAQESVCCLYFKGRPTWLPGNRCWGLSVRAVSEY